jgi:nitrite reductase/ring-hydroxylating ferredoxin subunit
VRVKVMGEDLIAFRDTRNRIGLVEPHCPHRGANLFFGRNEECGIRCAFHGWKFDVLGERLEMTTVPRNDNYERTRARIRLKAYPARGGRHRLGLSGAARDGNRAAGDGVHARAARPPFRLEEAAAMQLGAGV